MIDLSIEQFDVVVIGAGPSGAVASAMLARMGWRVLVLEKDQFPRFSIGESLLPQSMGFLAEAGLKELVEEAAPKYGFQFKNGAAFHKAGVDVAFDFTKKFSVGPGTTFQVKRAAFDKLLADSASDIGVLIRYEHKVRRFDNAQAEPVLSVVDESGDEYQVQGRFVLDASGFGRVLPRLLELERPSGFPVRQSIFAHIQDHINGQDFDRDKILITVHPEIRDIWYWLIPFSDGTASIGVVGKPEQLVPNGDMPLPERLRFWVSEDPNLASLLNRAEYLTEARTITGYSADVTSLVGKGYALLGNAGEFLDPVFSSGVTIALRSATLIAPVVDRYLKGEKMDFDSEFSQPLKQGVECFKTFVSAWYDGGFQDVIFSPQPNEKIRDMISSILAGYAWDANNPFVAESQRRLEALIGLCQKN